MDCLTIRFQRVVEDEIALCDGVIVAGSRPKTDTVIISNTGIPNNGVVMGWPRRRGLQVDSAGIGDGRRTIIAYHLIVMSPFLHKNTRADIFGIGVENRQGVSRVGVKIDPVHVHVRDFVAGDNVSVARLGPDTATGTPI